MSVPPDGDAAEYGEDRVADLAAHLPAPDRDRARTLIERCRETDAQTSVLLGARQDELRILLREHA